MNSLSRFLTTLATAALLLALGGCAAPGSDLHVAPLFTRLATADEGTETEAFGGMLFSRREHRPIVGGGGELSARALRPFYGWRRVGEDRERVDFLVPLGFWKRSGSSVNSLLAPLYYYRSAPAGWRDGEPGTLDTDGIQGEREFDLFVVPGIFWSKNRRGADKLGWFPFLGRLKDFATYDQMDFFLFPLYSKVRRGTDTLHNFLWPFFGLKTGDSDRVHWRVWPLVGRKAEPNRFERGFALWPLFVWNRERLGLPKEEQKRTFHSWPLIGLHRDRTYRSITSFWPFFGFAWDPRAKETGGEPFRALDFPWPFVRVQSGGAQPAADARLRFWPLYSYVEGDGLKWWTTAWPLVHRRLEVAEAYERASFYVLPFYQHWDLRRNQPEEKYPEVERWRRLWPLYRYERLGEARRLAFPSLSPLTRSSVFDFYYGWMWELFSIEREGSRSKHRSWLGLYRREADAYEQRTSIAGLWSSRHFEGPTGEVRETSLLFGLIRWRSGDPEAGPGLMRPAFPGPGWPSQWSRPLGSQRPSPSPFATGVPR